MQKILRLYTFYFTVETNILRLSLDSLLNKIETQCIVPLFTILQKYLLMLVTCTIVLVSANIFAWRCNCCAVCPGGGYCII